MKKQLTIWEIRNLQIDIVRIIDFFCKQNGLKYYFCYGSLIGAVRHKGYIPWDDDVDLVMRRKDYVYFFENFNSRNIADVRAVDYTIDKKYYLPYGKVISTKTSLYEDVTTKYELGVYVDIFPLDNVSCNILQSKRIYLKTKFLKSLLTLKTLTIKKDYNLFKNSFIVMAHIILMPFSHYKLICAMNKIAQSNDNQSDTKKLASYMCLIYGKREIWDASLFEKTEVLNFESVKIRCPYKYHEVLTQLYGDYMKLPPVEKQITHHDYNVYWKMNNT